MSAKKKARITTKAKVKPVAKKRVKKVKKLTVAQRFARLPRYTQMLVFGLIFGIIGVAYLYIVAANPNIDKQTQALFYYREGHGHEMFENDFERYDYPTILYADGMLVCGKHNHGEEAIDADLVPTATQANLTDNEIREFMDGIRRAGMDKLEAKNYKSNDELVDPVALQTSIFADYGRNQKLVSYSSGEMPTDFRAVADYAHNYCETKATAELETESYRVDTINASATIEGSTNSSVGLQRAQEAVTANLSKNDRLSKVVRNLDDLTKIQSNQVDFRTAKDIKAKLSGKSLGIIDVEGQAIAVRVTPMIRPYILRGTEQPVASEKGKVHAATAKKVEFVWFYPADRALDGGSGIKMADVSITARWWYKSALEKQMLVAGNRTVRGTRSLAQYETCPSGKNCSGDKLLAAFYNVQTELGTLTDAEVVVLFQGSEASCKGWGSGAGMSGSNNTVVSSRQGIGITNMTGCTWGDGWQKISAHELGHGFGSAHWCHNNNLMADAACSTKASTLGKTIMHSTQRNEWRARSQFFTTSPTHMVLGEVMYLNGALRSPQNKFRLQMQGDGNLVIYNNATGGSVWNSRTGGYAGSRTVFMGDGNLVVQKTNGTSCSSRTAGKGGNRITLGDDGNLVIRKSDGTAIWWTAGHPWYC